MDRNFSIFVLGVVAGIIVSIGLDVFRYYFFRPRLKIEAANPEDAKYYSCHSVRSRNVRRSVAKNAQGTITIHEIDASTLIPEELLKFGEELGFDSEKFGVTSKETVYLRAGGFREITQEPLCWSSVKNRDSIDIFPGMSRLLDVRRLPPDPDPLGIRMGSFASGSSTRNLLDQHLSSRRRCRANSAKISNVLHWNQLVPNHRLGAQRLGFAPAVKSVLHVNRTVTQHQVRTRPDSDT